MMINAENINVLWGYLIIEELVRSGVEYCCISPGSRSTPLAVAAARNPRLCKSVCYDERGAAFNVLGYARAAGKPGIVFTTSGTAAANCFPAVIEASIDCIPLIVITADRPPELRETGANQTIHQEHLFNNYVRWFFDLPCPDAHILPEAVLTTIDQAVFRALSSPNGPVHINCMFREPLVPTADDSIPEEYDSVLRKWMESRTPYTLYYPAEVNVHSRAISAAADIISNAQKPLFVAGKINSLLERISLKKLLENVEIPVFPDILSGLRTDVSLRNVIHYYDLMLLSEQFVQENHPDAIVHFGGQITSARFLQMIHRFPPEHYILINDHPFRSDPAHRVTMRITGSLPHVCNVLMSRELIGKTEWQEQLKNKSQKIESTVHSNIAQRQEITEIGVVRTVSDLIPEGQGLFLSSSMPIRDFDMYTPANSKTVFIAANRGASGIDGTIASSVGFAEGLNAPVTLVIGDLAFIYDINALHYLTSLRQKLIICLINNHGGGIFSFLPISNYDDVFEKYFAAPHSLHFKAAADLFSLAYANPKTAAEFRENYQTALQFPRSTLIEVETDRNDNLLIHREIQQLIKDIIEE